MRSFKSILLIAAFLMTSLMSLANTYYLSTSTGNIDYEEEEYVNNLHETYYINVGSMSKIQFYIDICVEEYSDSLYVYDVDHYGNETLILAVTGHHGTGTTTFSLSGRAKVVFVTDESVSYDDGDTELYGMYLYYFTTYPTSLPYQFFDSNLWIAGNVGIGVYEPQEKLHIGGSIRGNATGGALKVKTQHGYVDVGPQSSSYAHFSTDRSRYLFDKPIILQNGSLGSHGNTSLSLQTSDTSRVTIFNNGYVGIGTNSPEYRLDVKGGLRASEIIVEDIDSFPDYVFQADYSLRPINEEKSYIIEHGHLPEMPSTAEIQSQGMNLSQMQVQILKKVEELTLYVIKQQEAIESQQKTIDRQQSIIESQQREIDRLKQVENEIMNLR